MRFLRRRAGTACYLALLLATHVLVFHALPDGRRRRVLEGISTNLAGMDGWTAPFRLVAGALVADTSGTVLDQILIVGLGLGVCLSWLEERLGTLRAFAVAGAAHVLATLLVLAVVAVAVRTGRYPDEVRHAPDYGVSFASIGAVGAVTWLLPGWARVPWGVVAVLYPLTAATWYGWLPDFSSVGHVLSGAIGVALSVLLVRGTHPSTAAAPRS